MAECTGSVNFPVFRVFSDGASLSLLNVLGLFPPKDFDLLSLPSSESLNSFDK